MHHSVVSAPGRAHWTARGFLHRGAGDRPPATSSPLLHVLVPLLGTLIALGTCTGAVAGQRTEPAPTPAPEGAPAARPPGPQGAQLATPQGAQPTAPQNVQPATPPNAGPAAPQGTQPMAPRNAQPALPPNARPAAPARPVSPGFELPRRRVWPAGLGAAVALLLAGAIFLRSRMRGGKRHAAWAPLLTAEALPAPTPATELDPVAGLTDDPALQLLGEAELAAASVELEPDSVLVAGGDDV